MAWLGSAQGLAVASAPLPSFLSNFRVSFSKNKASSLSLLLSLHLQFLRAWNEKLAMLFLPSSALHRFHDVLLPLHFKNRPELVSDSPYTPKEELKNSGSHPLYRSHNTKPRQPSTAPTDRGNHAADLYGALLGTFVVCVYRG